MKISIVVGTIRAKTLGYAIESLMLQTLRDWEMIVVGQGEDRELSTLGAELEKRDSRIRYIHLAQRGLSRARNAGIAAASSDLIAFTDDDCIADPRWLEVLVECFEREPDTGLVAGSVVAPPPRKRGPSRCPSVSPEESLYEPAKERGRVPRGWDWMGANFAVRAKVFAEQGTFDECLGAGTEFPAGEDTDFKLRLEAAGIAMRCTPRAVVRHEYGHRYGLRGLLYLSKSYATGNGALAGKLTLLGDQRGEEWIRDRRQEWLSTLRPERLHLLPVKIASFYDYRSGYKRCLARYTIERKTGNLTPKHPQDAS